MSNYFNAKLTGIRKISVSIFSEFVLSENPNFICYKQNLERQNINIIHKISMNNLYIFEIALENDYDFSSPYYLTLDHYPYVVVDITEATRFPEFDQMFNYDGTDLGAIYSKSKTDFAVWCPLATNVQLFIEINDKFETYPMDRSEKGVYRISINGNLKNAKYHYIVTNNSIPIHTLDPYGKGTSLDSYYSVVIDFEEVKKLGTVAPTTSFNKYSEAIIYETHVKDFTLDKHTDIEQKGKFLGFVEPNRKTFGGHPAGLDYLVNLGITHVQLLPLCDYYGNGDKDTSWYNWGYDPISFFAIEGSLSSNPEEPSSRIKELKTMINKLHEKNIRVNLDVVYNHIYEYKLTAFDLTVPNYFFRRKNNGEIYMSSGCGNDFDSTRYMARKLIIDSLTYLLEMFDFDGFRFDLMGLLDVTTMNQINEILRKKKENIMLYGEGWHMHSSVPDEERASIVNASKLPNYAFFNDLYRDIAKGDNSKDGLYVKGFINGDVSYKFGFDYIFFGSCLKHTYNPRFIDAGQSINYLECHDNFTLFDKLSNSNRDEDIQTILRRVNLGNTCILFSFGIPFFHMGQEIGQSKYNNDNTYNVAKINNMSWKLVDERYDMVAYLKEMIALRKKYTFFNETNPEIIDNNFKAEYWDNNCIRFYCNTDFVKPYKSFALLINPENISKTYSLPDYTSLVMNKDNSWEIKNGIINPCKVDILYKV